MLTLEGREALINADVVVGFSTVLDVARPWLAHAEVRSMTYQNQEEVLEDAEGQVRDGKRCVVCCWGDLTVSASELLERVHRRFSDVKLVHSVSSVQVAMSRAGISLEDTVFVTLHKRANTVRELEEVVHYIDEGLRNVVLLPRPFDFMPAGIADGLLDAGVRADLPVKVYQRLTFKDEKQWAGILRECSEAAEEFSDLSIMVFLSGKTVHCEGD